MRYTVNYPSFDKMILSSESPAEMNLELRRKDTRNSPPYPSTNSSSDEKEQERNESESNGGDARPEWENNALKMKSCWCPAGSFTMGSAETEKDRGDDEDQVQVRLARGFWLGKYEVTKAQWRSVMKTWPWTVKENVERGDDLPAAYVSWDDALEFSRELTKRERAAGRLPASWKYRLPTEAEWEYGCRAGIRSAYSFGDDDSLLGESAWYSKNTDQVDADYAHRVGAKEPNRWGLHDMHGNVYEWCSDSYQSTLPGGTNPDVPRLSSFRVCRGGSWINLPHHCRSAARFRHAPTVRSHHVGFRVAIVQVSH